jgi:hypothetical protein
MSLAAPPAIYTPPSAGAPPSAAGAVFVPPSAGSPPSAAGAVFAPAPTGKAMLTISGATPAGVNGRVIFCGLINGQPAWSTDGTQTPGVANTIVDYAAGQWRITRSGSFAAVKTSASSVGPENLVLWTYTLGSGALVIAAFAVPTPPAITT